MNRNFFPKYIHSLIYPTLLAIFILLCILLILPKHSMFGSHGDWFSQHVAVAEQFRMIFYETGQIIPDISPAGAGSNSYDFSYYGLLRPDVLISFLLPKIPMGWILSGYAILELIAGAILCYYWLKQHLSCSFFAFFGGILYSCGTCFYHAHHQIMFVNYMPFLLLALLGIDRLLTKEKHELLVLALSLAYLHSYYFAPAILAVVFLYFLYRLYGEKKYSKKNGNRSYWLRLFFSIGISIGITAILLLPTGLDLLSTKKDAGVAPSFSEIFSIRLSLESLLYHPGGCGLTIVCFYTLLCSIRRKSTRILSIVLLFCLTVNVCPYVLSGLLYIRSKVLIPLVPLILLLCTQTLELIFTKKERHSLLCILACLVPVCLSEKSDVALIDVALMILVFVVIFLGEKYLFLLLCLAPSVLSITVGRHDQFIDASDNRQAVFSTKELEDLNLDTNYRFACLTEPFANANVLPLQGMGSPNMYSSVTDSNYADFFYNRMRNPIRIRNRVALMTDANPFFAYLMGIQYIQTKESYLPWGYEPIAKKGQTIIAKNSQVLPIAYASTLGMEQAEFEKLEFPYTLEALTKYTMIDSSTKSNQPANAFVGKEKKDNDWELPTITANDFMETSQITPVSVEMLTGKEPSALFKDVPFLSWNQEKENGTLKVSLKHDTEISLPFINPLENKILICSFQVESLKKKEVTIEINGIRNKLSGSNAPYPNRNHTFTYLISSNQEITALNMELKAGTYLLSELSFWVMDTSKWGNNNICLADVEKSMEKTLFQGSISCKTDSFFVTSFPFRKGYEAWIDEKKVPVQLVNEAFVGFPLTEGSHKITITYRPPGKTASAVISFVSLLIFFLGILLEHKRKQSKKNFRNLSWKGSQHK